MTENLNIIYILKPNINFMIRIKSKIWATKTTCNFSGNYNFCVLHNKLIFKWFEQKSSENTSSYNANILPWKLVRLGENKVDT